MDTATDLTLSVQQLMDVLPSLEKLSLELTTLGRHLLYGWNNGKKLLVAGNGGSAADAMHLAEELSVRFVKNRKALAAIALCDSSAITCAGNDFGFDTIFSRQVEALANPGDTLIVFSTSGNSTNLIRAVNAGRDRGATTCAFLGKGGGKLAGVCDIELIIESDITARIQECHKVLFHSLCSFVDRHVD